MISPLLLLLFLPFLTPACIDWTTCNTATCFTKYAKRDGLRIYDPEMEAPSIGVQLSHHTVQDPSTKIVTRVSIEVKAAGFQDDDFAAIVLGDKFLAGCYKGTKKLEPPSEYITMTSPQGTLDGDIFCCKDVDVANLNLDFIPVSSVRFLTLNYTTGNGATRVSLPTDFSAYLVFESLDYRKEVTCSLKSFRKETIAGADDKMDMPYYPLQDPKRGRCGVENHSIRKIEGNQFGKETFNVPMCIPTTKEWTFEAANIDLSTTPLRCVPREKQLRRSCAGKAPPGEILCGRNCGSLDPKFFDCPHKTGLHANYNSSTFYYVEKIRCTERGYEVKVFSDWILLPDQAKVRCNVTYPSEWRVTFLSFHRSLPILLGVSIYIILFTSAVVACVHIFSQWATRVEQIGPIRSPYGPVLSSRTVKASNTQPIRDESNRNTPSAQSGRSSKK